MSEKIIQFPRAPDDGGLTLEHWRAGLLVLHGRLSATLMKERKQIDSIRMVLSIDDVTDLMQVIESELGPEWFDNDTGPATA